MHGAWVRGTSQLMFVSVSRLSVGTFLEIPVIWTGSMYGSSFWLKHLAALLIESCRKVLVLGPSASPQDGQRRS